MRRTALASLLLWVAAVTPLRGQDIGAELSALTEGNAKLYVGPLARGLGHALTAGLVSSADPHGALGWSIGVRVVGALFEDKDKTFLVEVPTTLSYTPSALIGQQTYTNPYGPTKTVSSPTVAGAASGTVLTPQGQYRSDLVLAGRNPADFNLNMPKGFDLPLAPFAVIDAAVGIGFGTQVMARIVPTFDAGKLVGADEVGKVSAFGIGVMHNLTQYLPVPTPMWDVSVTFGTQKVNAGDYLEASGNTFGLVASAGVGPLSAYAHAASYKSDVDVDYTIKNTSNNPALPANGLQIAFQERVDRSARVLIGAQLDLVVIKLSAEYGMGDMKTISGRAAFGFR